MSIPKSVIELLTAIKELRQELLQKRARVLALQKNLAKAELKLENAVNDIDTCHASLEPMGGPDDIVILKDYILFTELLEKSETTAQAVELDIKTSLQQKISIEKEILQIEQTINEYQEQLSKPCKVIEFEKKQ